LSLILIVEDEPSLRGLLARILEAEGYEVAQAANGAQALAALRTLRPAAVLLDLVLPDVDGWQVLRSSQQLAARRPPILVAAANLTSRDIVCLRRLGARAWFEKPFDLDDLLATLARLVATPIS